MAAHIVIAFEPVSPDLGWLSTFWTDWRAFVGAVWGLVILATLYFLGSALARMGSAREAASPTDLAAARHSAVIAAVCLGGLASLGTIVGIILFAFT